MTRFVKVAVAEVPDPRNRAAVRNYLRDDNAGMRSLRMGLVNDAALATFDVLGPEVEHHDAWRFLKDTYPARRWWTVVGRASRLTKVERWTAWTFFSDPILFSREGRGYTNGRHRADAVLVSGAAFLVVEDPDV